MPTDGHSKRRIPSASQLAGASETRQLLGALVHLASELNSIHELPPLLSRVRLRACELTHADRGGLYLFDRKSSVFYRTCDGDAGTEALPYVLPLDSTPFDGVIHRRQTILDNAPTPERVAFFETEGAAPIRNWICVPLSARDTPIGLLWVGNREAGGAFGEDDLDLLTALSDLAAVAIANVQLHSDALERRRLEEEMNTARQIQERLLPQELPAVPGLSFEGQAIPAYHVGGDIYDAFALRDGRICGVVGDVSGKGVSAALYMACLHAELHMASEFMDEPASMLARLNDLMYRRSRHGAFVTLLMLVFDVQANEVTILSAGHPPPLVCCPPEVCAAPAVIRYGTALGMRPREQYVPSTISFPPGSMLLGYSDGVIDATSEEGAIYGLQSLQEAFTAAAKEGPPVLPSLLAKVKQHVGGATAYDDMAFFVAACHDS